MPHVPGEKDVETSTIVLCSLFAVVLCGVMLLIVRSAIRKRNQRLAGKAVIEATPVVVTSATHTAPGGYPVTQLPPPGYPAGNAYAAPVGYPAQTTGNVTVQMPMPMQPHNQQQMPMPMPGMQTHGVAYPPYPGAGAASMNPPPYDMAMANPGPSVMPSGYEKQAPYNPNFGQ
ncbi:probable pathogenesis-related protein ARB_02861 isoform X1 [Drosophila subpulchrella]|uniref:probable pathogenesis-related protein ARB_02861 isoform X1 n=1 Tax=Drosophila subpulchrella TaxID=1486046 RepID=UPI0018A158C5|nr:probable pathogenesis-related protein ARB_02861 isoform X1 [Drosophila subpulchrella]